MSKRHAWVAGCWRRLSTFLSRAAPGVTPTIVAQSVAARPAFTPSYSRKRAKVTIGSSSNQGSGAHSLDALFGGEAAQEELEHEHHVWYMNAHPLAQARYDGPLAHPQTQLVHRVRGE
eukprot:scaffold43908_cov65-Phaeocystis_antarctica.AAC.1